MLRTRRQHMIAVVTIALVAIIFGCGFAAMQTLLRGGLSVGASISVRFLLGLLGLSVFLKWKRVQFDRVSFRDGVVLGLILVGIFWLQTDGLRFTTTAKSGLITSLYVPLTPVILVFMGQRVKLSHGFAALVAGIGLYLLVHVPGSLWGGWNRGDFETLACSVLCALHVIYTAKFSRRSQALVLAWTQVGVTGVVSALITVFLPAPHGFQTTWAGLQRIDVLVALAFMVCLTTVFCFWAMSAMQRYLSATEASVVYSFEPVVATLVGVYWVGEEFLPSQFAGAVLILFAIITAEVLPRLLARFRPEELAESAAD
ncbi:MAG TPA: DMT family transporter [Terriglobales bacterium]|nr:DMT family transporter [Terriglobales bacterium]